jgi:hypothetical protein
LHALVVVVASLEHTRWFCKVTVVAHAVHSFSQPWVRFSLARDKGALLLLIYRDHVFGVLFTLTAHCTTFLGPDTLRALRWPRAPQRLIDICHTAELLHSCSDSTDAVWQLYAF